MDKKNSNSKFIIGIAVAVLLPLSFYLVVSKMSKGVIKIPGHYIVEKVDSINKDGKLVLDTVYHQVGDIMLTNQTGQQVSLSKDLKGKMVVIDFFFVDCPSICPKLTTNMRFLQNSFKKDPKKEETLENDVQFLSITVLPERDSVPRLRAYADRYGANHDHWWFLTGDKKAIYNFARNELGISTGPGDGGADDFIHSEKIVLLDKEHYIRGYYNGLSDTSANKCANDIVLLTLERKHKKK
jgi:protein SCO1/2